MARMTSRIGLGTLGLLMGLGAPRMAAQAYCEGTPLRNEIEARAGASLAEATAACALAIAERHGGGPVDAKIQAHVAMARN